MQHRGQFLASMQVALLALAGLAPAAMGQQTLPTDDAEALWGQVAPFVDASTLAVARLRVDDGAVHTALGAVQGAFERAGAAPALRDLLDEARIDTAQLAAFFEKAGVEWMWFVASYDGQRPTLLAVVPVDDDTAPDLVAQFLRNGIGGDGEIRPAWMAHLHAAAAETIGDAVVGGTADGVAAARRIRPAERPELKEAFAEALNLAPDCQVVLGATPAVLTALARAASGPDAEAALAGFRWAAAGLALEPRLRLRLVHQFRDDDSAAAWQRVTGTTLDGVPPGVVTDALGALHPLRRGSRLTASLTERQAAPLLERLLEEATGLGPLDAYRFRCTTCGTEFALTAEEAFAQEEAGGIACPNGHQGQVVPMLLCSQCGQWFDPPASGQRPVCPNCGYDPLRQ